MQNETENKACISPNIGHDWVFLRAEFGSSSYLCRLCGEFTEEYEDATP